MASRRVFLRVVLALLATSAAMLLATPVNAIQGDYPESTYAFWRPSTGHVNTGASKVWAGWNRVDETFQWVTSVSLREVDSPRTPYQHGTYEHELRFRDHGWCDPVITGIYNTFYDLPPDSYRDSSGIDPGEFSWGVQSWRLQQDHIYNIQFDCYPYQVAGNDYNLSGQVGHCHTSPPCTSNWTFADSTTRLIPRLKGRAPENQTWDDNFSGNRSFETTLSPWTAAGGSLTRDCTGTAFHGSCFAHLSDSGGALPSVSFSHTPSPVGAATASLIHEIAFRCPTSRSTNCQVELAVSTYDAYGNILQSQYTPVVNVCKCGWNMMWMHTNAFTVGSPRSWRFWVLAINHGNFDVDYDVNSWYLPN